MPVHYGSGTTPSFEVELNQDFSNNPDDIRWYRKQASDTSWTEIESESLQPEWDHNNGKSSDADYSADTFFLEDEGSLLTLNEGESQTVTVDGSEVTFEASGIYPGNNPPGVLLTIGGTEYVIVEGEYIEVNGVPVRADTITEDDVGNQRVELTSYNEEDNPADGQYDYRVVAQTNPSDLYYSQPLFFDISSLNNNNAPYIENVTINSQSIYDFESLSGIDPGATVRADVIEREGDAYNISLVDRTGSFDDKVQTVSVNSDGTVEDVYSVVLDFFFDPFFDTGGLKGDNSNRVAFKILPKERENAIDLFDINGTYDFGFRVVDENFDERKTADFTLTTDDTVLQPNITAIEGSGDCSTYSTLSGFDTRQPLNCIKVTATDSNDDDLFVALNLTEVYDAVDRNKYSTLANNYHQKNGDEYIFNLSKIDVPTNEVNASGKWRAEAIASDGLSNDTKTVSWNVPWGNLNMEMVEPSNDFSILRNGSFGMDLRLTCSGGPECVNQNESTSVFWDPKPVEKSSSLPGVFS